jgi:catalase
MTTVIDVKTTDKTGTGWREDFLGGSKETEDKMIRRQFAPAINRVQRDIRSLEGHSVFTRAQHGKMIVGTTNARFEVLPGLPDDLQAGPFRPGKQYAAQVRFSNGIGFELAGSAPDLRGVAVRVIDDEGKEYDFLMTNAPFSHVRDARQFMIVLSAATRQGGPMALWRLRAWRMSVAAVRVARRLGPGEALRVLRTIRRQISRPVASVAAEQYWSRAPFAFGPVAVKYMLNPDAPAGRGSAPDLRAELISRLRVGDVAFDFQVQRYIDDAKTPIEDAAVEWREEDAPPITVARLVIPRQEIDPDSEAEIEQAAFNPWNSASDEYRPLGSMNRARKLVYEASAKLRTESEG